MRVDSGAGECPCPTEVEEIDLDGVAPPLRKFGVEIGMEKTSQTKTRNRANNVSTLIRKLVTVKLRVEILNGYSPKANFFAKKVKLPAAVSGKPFFDNPGEMRRSFV